MRKLLLAPGVAALVALMLFAAPTHAANDAECAAVPGKGAVGTTFDFACNGFSPLTHLYAYLVQPDGTARAYGGVKSDASGAVTFSMASRNDESALALGTWTVVVEELGVGHSVTHRAQTNFTITGGTDGVGGATISANPGVVYLPQGVDHEPLDVPGGHGVANSPKSAPTDINGDGFAPNEVVTLWADQPNGGCGGMTGHFNIEERVVSSGLGFSSDREHINEPLLNGLSSFLLANAQSDHGGHIEIEIQFFTFDCVGLWHIVARGNSSGRGGDTWVAVRGNAVGNGATLTASPVAVRALYGRITFNGAGFASQEPLACWLTSPEGQVLGVPNDSEQSFIFSGGGLTHSRSSHSLSAATDGTLSFEIVTGGAYRQIDFETVLNGIVVDQEHRRELAPEQSEGALGEWAMTCRGAASGRTGIARFTLTGGIVDP